MIKEYYPNGSLKHVIKYHDNGSKYYEQFFDEDGLWHRENGLPDYQLWDENGRLKRKTYFVHEKYHNINSPAKLGFYRNGKISWKYYHLKESWALYTKLEWQNLIKNI